jgi:ParB family chromosome partitioning protein
LRLLELSEDIQKALQFGQITEGHGRALLMLSDPNLRHAAFLRILENKLSVRESETLAKQLEAGEVPMQTQTPAPKNSKARPADLQALEESLQQLLGTKVAIRTKKNPSKGTLIIHFFSYDDFDRIVKVLKK